MPALQISRRMDYALRALAYLASREGPQGSTLNEIAAHTAVSSQFLAKIIERLAQSGLVRSRRGPRGGYVLTRQPSQVSVNEIIEAVEGPIMLNTCIGDEGNCTLLPGCAMPSLWKKAQNRLVEVFSQTTLEDLRMAPGPAGRGLPLAGSRARPAVAQDAS